MGRALVILAVPLCIGSFVSACSETTRYRVLTFFFDGVPTPGSGAPAEPEGARAATPQPRLSQGAKAALRAPLFHVHPPYRAQRCGECHNRASGRLVRPVEAGLCQTCHQDKPGQAAYVHGPVAVNACLFCHHHHGSRHPKMLLEPLEDICFRCHDGADLTEGPHHAMLDGMACVECHNPHGGDDRFFLKRSEP